MCYILKNKAALIYTKVHKAGTIFKNQEPLDKQQQQGLAG